MNDCHVISEKPFLVNVNDWRCMQQLMLEAEENNKVAIINQQYRWIPRMQRIRQALDEKKIGDVKFVVSNFCQNRYHFNSWWRQEEQDLSQYNWFVHHYDTMRYLMNSNPETVRAKLIHVPWSKVWGESTIFLTVKFENGIEWSYTGVQEGVGAYEDSGQTTFTIYGSKGCIRNTKEKPPQLCIEKGDIHNPETTDLGPMDPWDKISTDSSVKEDAASGPKYPPGWTTTMKYFIEAVRSDNVKPHPTTLRDNFNTIAIALCARESHRLNGQEIKVREFLKFN
jgi:predicted dehydrogenase